MVIKDSLVFEIPKNDLPGQQTVYNGKEVRRISQNVILVTSISLPLRYQEYLKEFITFNTHL